MKKIGFIGAYDKTDLIIYVAKLIAANRPKNTHCGCNIITEDKIYNTMH